MADNILRLRVDSAEYDNKIKRAAEGIQQYAQKCREAGGTLSQLDDDVLEYVKSLGQMDTVAKNSKGILRELTNSYTELSHVYKNLTDEEKNSEFGQELNKQLDIMKGRIMASKNELNEINSELGNTSKSGSDAGSVIDMLAGKIGISTNAFVGFAAAGTAATVALEVAKKTIDATESSSDALAITQSQLNSAVDSFFRNLNEGSFDNFLTGLKNVTQAAREAYQAMDELSSFAVRYNPKNAADLREIDKLMKEARALASQGKKDEAQKKIDEAKAVAEQAKKNTLAYGQKEYEAGIASLRSLLGGTGVQYTDQQLAWYSNPANWDEIKRKANEYKEIQRQINEETNRTSKYNPLTRTYDVSDESKEYIRNRKAAITPEMVRAYNYLNTRDTAGTENGDAFIKATGQIYGKKMAEYAVDELNARIEQRGAMIEKSGGNGIKPKVKEKIVTDSIGEYEKQIADLRKTQKDVTTTEEWETLEHRIGELVIKVKKLKGELKDVPASISDATNKATDAQNKKIQDRMNDPETVSKGVGAIVKDIENKNKKEDKEEKKYLADGLGKLASGLGSIDSGFKSLGIDLGDGFDKVVGGLQGVSSILMGIQTIVNAIQVISSADALIPFANGGIVPHAANGYFVPGNSFSGDTTPILANAGELVLNESQQGVLASRLSDVGGMRNIQITGRLEGETIAICVDRFGRRTGKGELAFFKN